MSQRHWLPLIAALATGAIVVAATAGSINATESRSAFVAGGDGAWPLVEAARDQGLDALRLVSGPLALQVDTSLDPAKTLLVLVGPPRDHDAQEAEAVRDFLHAGGRLLVADDFGRANSVTAPLGVSFERVRLVEADGAMAASLEGREYLLRLDSPTALRMDEGTPHRVLVESSATSFLDRDGDGLISAGDPVGPFPVAVTLDVGDLGGRIVALADTGLLRAAGDADGVASNNAEFRRALLESLLPSGGQLVLDESRDATPDPWVAAVSTVMGAVSTDPWRPILVTLAVVTLGLGVLLFATDRWGPHRFSADYFVRRKDLLGGQEAQAPRDDPGSSPGAHWTLRGRATVFGGLVLVVAGLASGSPQATYAAAFLLLASALAVWERPVRVRAQRRLGTDRTHEDAPVDVEVSLEARGGHSHRIEVLDELPREFVMDRGHNWFQTWIGPRNPTHASYQLRPALRGPYQVGPLWVRSSDPFRLRTVETQALEGDAIQVHPRHDPLSRIPFQSKIPLMTLGPHLVNRAGDGSEFHALREYQTGDSIRIVNWKASARSKDLVVNQRVHESMATITIMVDARAVSGAGVVRLSPLNEACRAALGITAGAIQARDRVRVLVYGDGSREVAAGGGTQEVHELNNTLAALRPAGSTGFREAVQGVLPSLKARSPFILISGLEDDPSVCDGLREVRSRGAIPTVLALPIATEPLDPDEGPAEEGAARLQEDREKMILELRGAGVPVVPVEPGMPLSLALRLGVA